MARVNAQQWLEKWSRRMSAAGPDISAGVDRVQVAPGQQAAAASARMLEGITRSVTDGTWASQVSKVSLQDWKQSMKEKGVNRIAAGVQQATRTATPAIQALLSAVDAAKAEADALPRGTLEQNIQRSIAFQRAMSARAPKRQG